MEEIKPPDGPPASRRWPPQFSLRGLMIFVFGVAVGLSAMTSTRADWSYAVLAAATTWIVLGLINQVHDLWRAFGGRSDLSNDQRWGWRFAVLWRLAVAGLLIGYCVVRYLLARKIISLPEREHDMFDTGARLREALFYLSLVVVLCSVPRLRRTPRRSRWSLLLGALGGAAAACLCVVVWIERTCICFLVHVAIKGIAMVQPLWLSREVLKVYGDARSEAFFRLSLLAVIFLLASLALIRQLARQWPRGPRRRLIWTGLLLPSLAVTISYPIWVYTRGLERVAPRMAEALQMGPLHRWIFALPVLIVLVTAATWRIVGNPGDPVCDPKLNWRVRQRSYYHERLAVIMVLAVALVMFFGERYAAIAQPGTPFSVWQETVWPLFGEYLCLQAAVLLLAVQGTLSGWFRPVDPQPAGPPELPPARFCAVWCALFVTAIFGIPAIALFSFSVWLSGWHLLPWP